MSVTYVGNGIELTNGVTQEEWDALSDEEMTDIWIERERLTKEGILIHDRTMEQWNVILQEIKEMREKREATKKRWVVMSNCCRRKNDDRLKKEWKKHPFLEGICVRCVDTGNGGWYRKVIIHTDKKIVANQKLRYWLDRTNWSGNGYAPTIIDRKEKKEGK